MVENGLYSRFSSREDSVDEPNGFITQPFRYRPELGGYPDLYNHLFGLSALGAASFIGHI